VIKGVTIKKPRKGDKKLGEMKGKRKTHEETERQINTKKEKRKWHNGEETREEKRRSLKLI
jgi:hypothetical protein